MEFGNRIAKSAWGRLLHRRRSPRSHEWRYRAAGRLRHQAGLRQPGRGSRPGRAGAADHLAHRQRRGLCGWPVLLRSSALKAFAGLRYTRQTLDGSASSAFTGVKNSGSTDDNNGSGRLGAAYNFSHNLMLYSSISRGYQSPFFQVPSDPTVAPTFIGGEQPVTYEIGFSDSADPVNDYPQHWQLGVTLRQVGLSFEMKF